MRKLDQFEHLKLLIICSTGLGDAVLQMVLAENLARAGFAVTYISDHAASLNTRVQRYKIMGFPAYDELYAIADSYPVILYDDGSLYIKEMPDDLQHWFRNNGIAYRVCKGTPVHQDITRDKVAARLPQGSKDLASSLIQFNAPIRRSSHGRNRLTIIDNIDRFLRCQIGLSDVTRDTGLVVRPQIRSKQKILIHPTSSSVNKNWGPQQFLTLAEKLAADGYRPVFTVAPAERDQWLQLVGHKFEVPLFESILELVDFYQDAAIFLGNDSGNAHLASSLGVLTFQIFNRWRKKPGWRAGWSPGAVVIARFPYSLSRAHWQAGLSVERVHRNFRRWGKTLEDDA